MKTQKFATVQAQFATAFETRIASADNDNMRDFLRKMSQRFASLNEAQSKAIQSSDINLQTLAERFAVSDKKNADFIAQYAIEKIAKTLQAIASGSASQLDKYSFSILKNLHKLQTLDNLNTQRALCNKIELDELATEQAVRVYHNCSPSTASTQASSTRQALQALSVCNVRKGSKGDSLSFTDSLSAQAVQALFAEA